MGQASSQGSTWLVKSLGARLAPREPSQRLVVLGPTA